MVGIRAFGSCNVVWGGASLLVTVAAACNPGDGRKPVTSDRAARIGPAGGELHLDELSIIIPPGALGAEVELTAGRIAPPPGFAGPWFEVGPSGLRFERPVSVELAYAPPGEQSLHRLFTAVDGRLASVSSSSATASGVLGHVRHLSPFGAGVIDPPYAESATDAVAHRGVVAVAAGAGGLWLSVLPARIHLAATQPPGNEVVVTGLQPGAVWHLYRDSLAAGAVITADAVGTLTFIAGPSTHFYLHATASTRVVEDECSCKGGSLVAGVCQVPSGTPPASWHAATRTCRLEADVATAFELTAGVTLNCQDHLIWALGDQAAAVSWFGGTTAAVLNCRIKGFAVGVALADVKPGGLPAPPPGRPGGFIDQVEVQDGRGIELWGAAEVKVGGLRVQTARDGGVLVLDSQDVFIVATEIVLDEHPTKEPGWGVQAAGASDRLRLEDVRVSGDGDGINLDSVSRGAVATGVRIESCNLSSLTRPALLLFGDWSGLPEAQRPVFWHNNVTGAGHEFTAFQVYAWPPFGGPLELSGAGAGRREGNWWGRGNETGGYVGGPLFVAGIDSNRSDLIDSAPYCRANGWSFADTPCTCGQAGVPECVNTPPAPIAQLVVTPPSGTIDTAFVLDASASYSRAGSPLLFRFRAEGGEAWTAWQAEPILTGRIFQRAGVFSPVVEVRDTGNDAFSRARAAPTTVLALSPRVTGVQPSPIPRHSLYQPPVAVWVSGSGLSLQTEMTLAGVALQPIDRSVGSGGDNRLLVELPGGLLPDVAAALLVVRNLGPNGEWLEDQWLAAVARAQPAVIVVTPGEITVANRSHDLTVNGGYFYPSATRAAVELLVPGASGPQWFPLAVTEIGPGGLSATLAVPELLIDEQVPPLSPLALLLDNLGAGPEEWTRYELVVGYPRPHPWLERVEDLALPGAPGAFSASYANEPVQLALLGQGLRDAAVLRVHNLQHPRRVRVFELMPAAPTSGWTVFAQCLRFFGTGDLFDGPVELRVAYSDGGSWSPPYLMTPVYTAPQIDRHKPDALQARPSASAVGPQYVTLSGRELFTETRVEILSGAAPGPEAGSRTRCAYPVEARTYPDEAGELAVEIPGCATDSWRIIPQTGARRMAEWHPVVLQLTNPGAAPAERTVPVYFLGEHGSRTTSSEMVNFGGGVDDTFRYGRLPGALQAINHDFLGGTSYSWFDEAGVLQTRLVWFSRSRHRCAAELRGVGFANYRRYYLSPTSRHDLEWGGTARRYEWNVNEQDEDGDAGPLLPGEIYQYSIWCTDGSSGAPSGWEHVVADETHFRTPDATWAPHQRQAQFAVVGDLASCANWSDHAFGAFVDCSCQLFESCDNGLSPAKHMLHQWRVANTLQHYFYRGALDFVLGAGDISDSNGESWTFYERVMPFYEGVMAGASFIPVYGNHDISNAKSVHTIKKFFRFFELPEHDDSFDRTYDQCRNDEFGCLSDYPPNRYFAMTQGSVGVTALDNPWGAGKEKYLHYGFGWLRPTYGPYTYGGIDYNLWPMSTPQWVWLHAGLPALAGRTSWVFGLAHTIEDQRGCVAYPALCGLFGLGTDLYTPAQLAAGWAGGIDIMLEGHSGTRGINYARAVDPAQGEGQSYASGWQQFSGNCKGDGGSCKLYEGFMHYSVSPERVIVRRVDVGIGADDSDYGTGDVDYRPTGLVTGCWVVEKDVFPKAPYPDADGVFTPATDCRPDVADLQNDQTLQAIFGDAATLEQEFHLASPLRGLDDRSRFADPPASAFLTECRPGRLVRYNRDRSDELRDASCTMCSCAGNTCTRIRKYIVRTILQSDIVTELQVRIPEWDHLCEVIP